METNIRKNFIWNLVGSVIYSFSSLFLMIIVTRINGVKDAGIFTFAFSIACLFQVISNYFGRTFQVTNTDKNILDGDFLYHRIFTGFIMLMMVVGYLLIQDYSNYKVIIIVLWVIYRLIESFSEIFYAVIQRNEQLYKVGISLFLKTIFGVSAFLVADFFSHNMLFSIIVIVIVNFLISLLYDFKLFLGFYQKTSFDKKKMKTLFISGFCVFIFTFLVQFILNEPKYTIDSLMNDSMQTIYGIISMPATFMVLCSQLVIQPFLGNMTLQLQNKSYKEFLRLNIKVIVFIVLVGIVAVIACYFIGIPILEFIYGISLKRYLNSLLIIIMGSVFFGISYICSTSLTTMRRTFIQVIFYIVISIIIVILSRVLIIDYGILGASISYSVSMFVLGVIFFMILVLSLKKMEKKVK